MRDRLLSYLCLGLIFTTAFFVLSFNAGFGYVYVQWLGWQIQSNLLITLLLFFICVLFLSALISLMVKVFNWQTQDNRNPKKFEQLYPYERMGIVWLLHGEQSEQQLIIQTYQASHLLYPLVRARLSLKRGEIDAAKDWLSQAKNPLFEIAELLKIDVALLEKNAEQALQRLEFLSVQPLSSWLQPIEQAYQAELQDKWLQLSQICPWWILRASHQPIFDHAQQSLWLQALLVQAEAATLEDQALLWQYLQQSKTSLKPEDISIDILTLKLMSQFDQWNAACADFAQQILQQRFVPEVLYIWLDKTLADDDSDRDAMAQQVHTWQTQYPAQPSLTFAQWHIYQQQGQAAEAQHLLTQFPEDAYMAYLRLQDCIQYSPELQADLKLLLRYSKQDFKFDL